MREIITSLSESNESKNSEHLQWKIPVGVLLMGILLLFYLLPFIEWFLPPLGFAVLYGVLSDDLKLSALFGFLFQLDSYLVLFLRFLEAPSPLIISYFLIMGLITALLGGISARIGKNVRNKSLGFPTFRWKAHVGVLLTGILLLYYTTAFTEGGLWISLAFLFAVFYGVLSGDFKLSTFFGFLFYLGFPLAVLLFSHDVPPPSAMPFILLWGLVSALLGGISAWIGGRAR